MTRLLPLLTLASALTLSATTASAQGKYGPDRLVRSSLSQKTNASGRLGAPALPRADATTLTQSVSQDILPGNGLACGDGVDLTTDNSFFRVFNLADEGVAEFTPTQVEFGVDTATSSSGTQPATLNFYTLSGAFTRANLTLIGSTAFDVPDQNASLFSVTVPGIGTASGNDLLVVELRFEDTGNGFFPGTNADGEDAPTYIATDACGLPDPLSFDALGYEGTHWVLNVTGNAAPVTGPNLTASPGMVAFGRVDVGQTTAARTVTLTNTGTADVAISSITSSGAPFTLNQTGADFSLAVGESTTISATFSPTAVGPAAGTITVTSNAAGSSRTINLFGMGIGRPPNDDIANATVITPGTYAGSNVNATLEGPDDDASCGFTGRNSVWWSYTPPSSGTVTVSTDGSSFDTVLSLHQPGTTEIACDDDSGAHLQSLLTNVPVTGGSPVLIRVVGFAAGEGDIVLTLAAALSGPGLTLSPATVTFPATEVGTTATRTVAITNSGNAPLTLTSAEVTGSAEIAVSGFTAGTLAVGAARTLTVTYAPTAPGSAAATLAVASDAPDSPDTVAITGTAGVGVPASHQSPDTPVAIPDGDPVGITSTIVVPATDEGWITDLDVELDISHTWVGDLVVTITGPTATAVLADQPGLPASTFGCPTSNMRLVVDDGGLDGTIEDGCSQAEAGEAYITGGRYTPATPLAAFDGTLVAGAYTLTVSDLFATDPGTLNAWALIVTVSLRSGTVAEESGPDALASRLSVAPNPLAGQGQIDLTIATAQDVRVVLYDALGREVRVLLDRAMSAGQQAYIGFATSDLPAGVYVVRASGTEVSLMQRITVVR